MANILRTAKHKTKLELEKFTYSKKQKIFCVGRNKTGTTSIAKAMNKLGFKVGNQTEFPKLFEDWVNRDFSRIINLCKKAEFFQDFPFSLAYTFIAMDQAFPGSKFILTIRDNPEQWYNSLIKFHGKLWGNGNIPPTIEDLKRVTNVSMESAYYYFKKTMNIPDGKLYDKELYIEHYKMHNKIVIDYFKHRQNDLLVLNIAEKGAYQKLCVFLNIISDETEFPWENKTEHLHIRSNQKLKN